MKGVVFTEFLDFTESSFGDELLEDVVEAVDFPHGCSYTAVGTYPSAEMVALVSELARQSGTGAQVLLRAFGEHLLRALHRRFPMFFEVDGPIELLARVDDTIHVEVVKLFPDAELPTFEVLERTDTSIRLRYRSPRCLGPLAEGLIAGALEHWGRTGSIRTNVEEADGSVLVFEVALE